MAVSLSNALVRLAWPSVFASASCFYCKKPGHFRRNCRLLARHQREEEQKVKTNPKHDSRGNGLCFMAGGDRNKSGSWYIDSGASCHMTNDRSFFSEFLVGVGPKAVLANGKMVETAGCGEGIVYGIDGDGKAIDVKLENVLYVPSLKSGLVSVDRMTAKGFAVVFRANGCEVLDETGKVRVVGERSGTLYSLKQAEKQAEVANYVQTHVWFPLEKKRKGEMKAKKKSVEGYSVQNKQWSSDTKTASTGRYVQEEIRQEESCTDSATSVDVLCVAPKLDRQSMKSDTEDPGIEFSAGKEVEHFYDVIECDSEEDPLSRKEEQDEPKGVGQSDRRNRSTFTGRLFDFMVMYAEVLAGSTWDP